MKKLVWVLGVVAIAVLAKAVLSRPDVHADPAPAVVHVRRRAPEAVKATGVIKPMIGAEVRVGARVSGIVRRLYVRIGDVVERGQLLAELDDRELVARRNQATA